jgi:hypothetical protein
MANMKEFFAEVDAIKASIAAAKRKISEIDQFHSKALTAITGEQGGIAINLRL